MTQQIIANYLKEHIHAVEFLHQKTDLIQKAAEAVIECFKTGGKILLCGNGGSAADAQHIAGEFVGRFKNNRQPLPAVALSTDSSVLTCIANDFSFEHVFSRGVFALGQKGDILWVFTTSGRSPNIIHAIQAAKTKQMKVLAFTGIADSPAQKMADICLCAENASVSCAQEILQISYHIICLLVDRAYPTN